MNQTRQGDNMVNGESGAQVGYQAGDLQMAQQRILGRAF